MPLIDDRTRKTVEEEFKRLQHPVKLIFFSQEMECGYCKDAHEMLAELTALNKLVSLQLYDLVRDKDEVKKYGIERIPALVILAGDVDFGFRYYGLPTGYEFGALINMIVVASRRDSSLTPKVREELKKIINDLEIKIFVIPTCPHCPTAAYAAGKFAFENRNIRVNVIEAVEFPHLVQKYAVMATPKIVINDTVSFEGALPEPLFIQYLLHAQEHLLEKGGEPTGSA